LTGGELINLDCNSVIWAFGIKLTFYNLCAQQATIHSVGATGLPAKLPAGYSYVMGLQLEILTNNQIIKSLPNGTGIEMDYPLNDQSREQLVLLYWNDPDGDGKGEWVEFTKPLGKDKLTPALTTKAADEFYKLNPLAREVIFSTLTTDKTGIFILVKK